MEKFLSWDFALVIVFAFVLFAVHEYGHFLAYKVFGIPAMLRRSVLVPGIDPKITVSVNRCKGMFIALAGFLFSTLIVVFPLYLFHYKHSFLLLLGSAAGSVVDVIWALSMLGSKTVTLSAKAHK